MLNDLKRHLAIFYLLHALVLRIFEFELTATTTRAKPCVYIVKKILHIFFTAGFLEEERFFYVANFFQSGFHGFVIFVVKGFCI